MPDSPSLDRRLSRLTELLARFRPLWRPLPFQHLVPPWAQACPDLHTTLLALGEDRLERLQAEPFVDSPLADRLPVSELGALCALPRLAPDTVTLPEAWSRHVGGRKWRQIEAFLPRVQLAPGETALEWCAGKGHLARTLARRWGREVVALEWDPALCADGEALARAQGLPMRPACQDVMAPTASRWLTPATHACALHACGDLHRRLLEAATAAGSAVTLAPCCYQRSTAGHYRPLSAAAGAQMAAHGLALDRDDLALAVQETVTAPRGVRRQRRRASAWRLGFDLLQREVRGVDAYLPVPSLAYGRMPESFAGFCRWAAAQKGITLPAGLDWVALEAEGWGRQAEVARLETLRHLFRRPLEVWLALDRAAFLAEAGYVVDVGTFCERELTPRNLMIRGRPSIG
ncbi:MAG: methyltransferase [Halomonas sp.]